MAEVRALLFLISRRLCISTPVYQVREFKSLKNHNTRADTANRYERVPGIWKLFHDLIHNGSDRSLWQGCYPTRISFFCLETTIEFTISWNGGFKPQSVKKSLSKYLIMIVFNISLARYVMSTFLSSPRAKLKATPDFWIRQ